MQEEGRKPFAVVEPVEHDGKLFVVHSLAGHGYFDGFCLGVLLQMALPAELVQIENIVVGAQGVKYRPVEQVFGCVVGAIVAAPARNAEEISAGVEVVVEKGPTAFSLRSQQFPFQQGPVRGRHRRVDLNCGVHLGGSSTLVLRV